MEITEKNNPINQLKEETIRMVREHQDILDQVSSEFAGALADLKRLRTTPGRLERLTQITSELDSKVPPTR